MSSDGARRSTVLVVDDSALMRTVISDVISGFADFRVVGTARDGREALEQIRALDPDILTLDVEMPVLDGLATLERVMGESPRAVVMLSAAESIGDVDLTLRALELGAVEFVRKPAAAGSQRVLRVADRLREALRAASVANLRGVDVPARQPRAPVRAVRALSGARAAVVIAASTGGPRALAHVVPALARELDAAVLVAQHMPPGFTEGLARRLDQRSALEVTEATDGEVVLSNHVYIAPGGLHMTVVPGVGGARIALDASAPVWGVRPAADPLFVSAAACFRALLVGVVLTGMGHDGSAGLLAIRNAGGGAVVQDRTSSAIFGMPQSAVDVAGADRVVSLEQVASAVTELLGARRVAREAP